MTRKDVDMAKLTEQYTKFRDTCVHPAKGVND